MVFLYLIILIAVFVIWIMARNLELPPGITEDGIGRELLKVSLFIYNKLFRKRNPVKLESVRGYLTVLSNRKDIEQMETEYFIRKICIFLVMTLAGSLLALMMALSGMRGAHIVDGGTVSRKSYGEGSFETELVASKEDGEEIGEFDVLVNERSYTKEEADKLFEEASTEMERLILAENEELDEVRTDLDLVESVPGYPFSVYWKIDDYELMHYDGSLETDKIPSTGAVVTLTATYKYGDLSWQQVIPVNLIQKSLSPKERMIAGIQKLIKSADEKSVYDEQITLPQTYEGQAIVWKVKNEDNSLLILILTIIGGAAAYIFKDKELKRTMEERTEQMLSDYPQLVSKLVLYLGAGMTVRNVFEKLGRTYLKKLEQGGQKHFVYEELVRATRELSSGASEADVYERFGMRCVSQQYTRLSTLLSQNLRKGNSSLLNVLNEEATKAFNERMDTARKLGEEAGTKLLLPMILMLVIVMVIIMIPAYMAF